MPDGGIDFPLQNPTGGRALTRPHGQWIDMLVSDAPAKAVPRGKSAANPDCTLRPEDTWTMTP
ncbi:hypothetical protein mvi_08870 [Methylobacterium indicum]|uniref:Uncharacterized protein n=1 Tax=Methylobacterium indicum TaxID=1775910 RepID=A0A8H9C4M6_9HYPH|nr:hypothetical protein mvi_08870 [Methylobacterium indicum]